MRPVAHPNPFRLSLVRGADYRRGHGGASVGRAPGGLPRLLIWSIALLMVVPLAAPFASASPPVAYGKFCATGVSCVPYADSTQPNFPYSSPVLNSTPLADGAFIYDVQVGVEIVNGNPSPASFEVVTETWIPGTQTVYENVTGPNGTYRLEPVKVPARLDPSWSNGTVFAEPFSSGELELPLRTRTSTVDLEVKIGEASWQLTYLTPATSSLAGVYSVGGIWAFGELVAGVTFAALLVGLAFARKLAGRIGRSPPVIALWPIAWISVPVAWFLLGYVSFNQTLGPMSPAVLPVPMVVAAFPYLPRLFTRGFEMAELEGISPVTLDEAQNPKAVVPIVRTQGGLRCAPMTWREALWSHWLGLPEVIGYQIKMLGATARIQPRLVPVTNPLGPYHRAEVTASAWFDARRGMKRLPHHLQWIHGTRTETVAADGSRSVVKTHGHFALARGYLEGTFPPKRPVAEELAGVRSAEVAEHDHEIIRVENAELRGSMDHLALERMAEERTWNEEARNRQDRPRTRDEVRRAVEQRRKTKEASQSAEDRSAQR